mmetsp:Transcript_95995/g.213713  ORF Transcript_95995/g.213713 Transcript_95995/m.213713 type:complete len:150 (-) Transcript_95995:141-590(-)
MGLYDMGIGAAIQNFRVGPSLWYMYLASPHLLRMEVGLEMAPMVIVAWTSTIFLIVMGVNDTSSVLGGVAERTKSFRDTFDGNCGFLLQTVLIWIMCYFASLAAGGDYTSWWGALTLTYLLGESLFLACLPFVLCARLICGCKKRTKTD